MSDIKEIGKIIRLYFKEGECEHFVYDMAEEISRRYIKRSDVLDWIRVHKLRFNEKNGLFENSNGLFMSEQIRADGYNLAISDLSGEIKGGIMKIRCEQCGELYNTNLRGKVMSIYRMLSLRNIILCPSCMEEWDNDKVSDKIGGKR